jgi:hypothetical protein
MIPEAPVTLPPKVWLCRECGLPVPWVSTPSGGRSLTHTAPCGRPCGSSKMGFRKSTRTEHFKDSCSSCNPSVCVIHYLRAPRGQRLPPPTVPMSVSRMRAMVHGLRASGWAIEVRHATRGDLIPTE